MRGLTVASVVVLGIGALLPVVGWPFPAQAVASANPYVGKYSGPVAGSGGWLWSVTVGKNGNVTGSFGPATIPYVGGTAAGSFKGTLGDDGALAVSGSWTSRVPWVCYDGCIIDNPPRWVRTTTTFAALAQMTADADGNLLGTASSGEPFVWTRR